MTETRNPIQVIIDDVMLPYQREHIISNDRFRWLCWSRQIGKSTAGSFRRLIRGIARERNQLFLPAGERQSKELMTKVADHLKAMQRAFELREDEQEVFEGGHAVTFHSAPVGHSGPSPGYSLPHPSHPGTTRRANSSSRGPGQTLSIIRYARSGTSPLYLKL